MGSVLAWVTQVVCLRGKRASVVGVGVMLVCVAWVGLVACLRECHGIIIIVVAVVVVMFIVIIIIIIIVIEMLSRKKMLNVFF